MSTETLQQQIENKADQTLRKFIYNTIKPIDDLGNSLYPRNNYIQIADTFRNQVFEALKVANRDKAVKDFISKVDSLDEQISDLRDELNQ